MAEIRLKFGKGDTPTEAMAIDPTGTEDPRRMTELLNMAAGRAAMARIGQRLFGHSLVTATKEGLMCSGQSWWEHSYKGAKTDKEARENFVTFAQEQGDPFFTISCQPPDSYIYFGAARWADQGFPTITMGETPAPINRELAERGRSLRRPVRNRDPRRLVRRDTRAVEGVRDRDSTGDPTPDHGLRSRATETDESYAHPCSASRHRWGDARGRHRVVVDALQRVRSTLLATGHLSIRLFLRT